MQASFSWVGQIFKRQAMLVQLAERELEIVFQLGNFRPLAGFDEGEGSWWTMSRLTTCALSIFRIPAIKPRILKNQ